MKAEDTVMDSETVAVMWNEGIDRYNKNTPKYMRKDWEMSLEATLGIAQAQAEITWDKAIREVVEWILEEFEDKYECYLGMVEWGNDGLFHGYMLPMKFTETLKKKWGIK